MQLLRQFGNISNLVTPYDRNFAFVEFEEKESAEKLLKASNSTEGLKVNSERVIVKEMTEKRNTFGYANQYHRGTNLVNHYPDSFRVRSPERFRDRSPERFRDRSPERFRVRSRDRPRDRSRDRSRDRYHDRSRDSYRDRSRDSYRDRSSDLFRGCPRGCPRDRSPDRFRSSSRNRFPNGFHNHLDYSYESSLQHFEQTTQYCSPAGLNQTQFETYSKACTTQHEKYSVSSSKPISSKEEMENLIKLFEKNTRLLL